MSKEAAYQSSKIYELTATIASGQVESNAIDLLGTELVGIFIPSTFDGTSITLKAAASFMGTYVPVQDGDGNPFTLTTNANSYVPIKNLSITAGLQFIKLATGSAQSTTSTAFTLAIRPL